MCILDGVGTVTMSAAMRMSKIRLVYVRDLESGLACMQGRYSDLDRGIEAEAPVDDFYVIIDGLWYANNCNVVVALASLQNMRAHLSVQALVQETMLTSTLTSA
jgi:hypothetical protein